VLKNGRSYKIPSATFDRHELIFGHDSPYKVWDRSPRKKSKIEFDLISWAIMKVDKGPESFKGGLQEILAWTEGEDGVQR